MNDRTQIGDMVRKFCLENPDMPNKTLAKIIYFHNPQAFGSVEQIRSNIRYYKGKSGKANRKTIMNTYGKYI